MYYKGQSQLVGAVLIIAILLGAVSAAYVGFMPLIKKNRDTNKLDRAYTSIENLNDVIQSVAQQGGKRSISLDLSGAHAVIKPINNSIEYQTTTSSPYVTTVGWVPMNVNFAPGIPAVDDNWRSNYGLRGKDNPGVILGRAIESGSKYINTFRLRFRQLIDSNTRRGYLINLSRMGQSQLQATDGTHTLVIHSAGDEVSPGASKENTDLVHRKVEVGLR